MASHAHSTRTPLLRQTTGSAGLLPAGLPRGRIVAAGGPVTRALAVLRGADPDLERLRTFKRAIASRIEADIALLDALSGDPDLEPTMGFVAPGYIDEAEGCPLGLDPDREGNTDDNGIADPAGAGEQGFNPYFYGYDASRPIDGGCGL